MSDTDWGDQLREAMKAGRAGEFLYDRFMALAKHKDTTILRDSSVPEVMAPAIASVLTAETMRQSNPVLQSITMALMEKLKDPIAEMVAAAYCWGWKDRERILRLARNLDFVVAEEEEADSE